MHSPDAGSAKWARLDLQKVYDFYLRVVCGLSSSTLCSMLLTELGVLPLQVFWWRQTLRFWNNIAALPVGSFFHTVLLDILYDAFHHGAFNFTSSMAACLHWVGVSMPCDTDRVPMLDISVVIDALKADLRGLGASTVSCPRQAPSCGVVQCTYDRWFQPFSARTTRRYCQSPVSGKNMKRFLQFRLGCRTAVAGACRLCTFCDAGAVGDKKHLMKRKENLHRQAS